MSKTNLFHASPSIIVELRSEPMWFSYSEDISKGYYDFSEGKLKYIHEYELTGGHFLSLMGIRSWCYDNGIDFEKMESELRDNPDSVFDIDGVAEIAEKCDGFEHNDHSPVDGLKEILALLIFDPSKNLRLVNITNLEDDENKEAAMTDVGVEMGKKTSLSEVILREAAGIPTFDDWVAKYSESDKTETTGDVYYFVDPGQYQEAMDSLRKVMVADSNVKNSYLDHGDEHPSGYGFFAFKHTITAPKPEMYKNGKTKRIPTVKRGDVQNIFGDANDPTYKNDCGRIKALLYLFDRQTDDEQNTESTNHHNRMGFTGTDAQLLSSFAKQVIQKAWLSPRQMQVLRKKIHKYAGQMARVANVCKKEGKDGVIGDQARKWAQNNSKNYVKREGTEDYYLVGN